MKLRRAFADANKIVRRSMDFRYIGELTVIARVAVLSHANSISLLIYTLLYTALNKNNGVTKVNSGRMSIR